MKRLFFAITTAALLAGCQTAPYDPYGAPYPPYQQDPGPTPYPPGGYYPPDPGPNPGPGQASCPITGSGEWRAWVNAMPGPDSRPKLMVTGKVTVPTGGYQVGFDPQLQIRESHPAQAFATLRVRPPSGAATQAVMTHEVRWEWPLTQQIGSLEIHCGDRTLARISPVERAY